jgi:c-di-GMP-binding flagellar brake protein YcgR
LTTETENARTVERRRETRIPVQFPMLIRGRDRNGKSFEERTVVQNLSGGGAAFTTLNPLDMGTTILVSLSASPPDQPHSEFSTKAEVVYSKSDKDGQATTLGVKFIGPRFQRSSISVLA